MEEMEEYVVLVLVVMMNQMIMVVVVGVGCVAVGGYYDQRLMSGMVGVAVRGMC